MIKQFGILLQSLGPSQQGLCILKNLCDISQKDYRYSPVIFYHTYGFPYINANLPLLPDIEAWSFQGPIISTDIKTTHILSKCLAPSHKYFYIWDLEWIYTLDRNFDFLKLIYLNPEIDLIARTKEHANILTKVWKTPITIIEDFNSNDITKLIDKSC